MNKPRILIVIDRFYPIIGGAETQALNLANYLHKNNHEVTVLTRQLTKNLKRSEKVNGIPVFRVAGSGFKRVSQYKMALSLPFNLFKMRKNYDIVHCSDIFSIVGLSAIISSKLLGKKITGRFTTIGMSKTGIPSRLIKPKILNFLDTAICSSNTVAKEAQKIGIRNDKIVIIRHGLDISMFKPATQQEKSKLREKLNLNPKRIVLFVGRLTSVKRPDMLLNVWKMLKDEQREYYDASMLLFLGSGSLQESSLESYLKKFVDENNLNNVRFLGNVYDVENYYRAADVVVVPSEKDLPSNVLLEGMLSGLGAITADIPPNREVIEPSYNGLLFKHLDEKDLFKNLLKLLSNNKLLDKISKNATKIKDEYSSSIVGKKYLEVYQKLLH